MLKSLPNILTLLRIILIIPIVGLFYADTAQGYIAAFALFLVAIITDFFDGMLARKLNVISPFGTFLDPIADKLLITAMLIVFVDIEILHGVWVIPVIIILLREMLVSGLREYLGPYKIKLPVTKLAKWKTTLQMIAVGVLMLSPIVIFARESGLFLVSLAATITFITGYDYISKGLKAMKEINS